MALNREERILLVGSNLWYLGEGMLGPLFAVFAERVGGSILDISWAWATYLLTTGTLMMIIGKLSDGPISKERMMITGYALNALFTFGYLFIKTPVHLFVVQAGLGLAYALATPTWAGLFEFYRSKKHAGYAWGLADGQAYFTTGVAIFIGGFIVNYFSFTVLFLIMGTVQVITTIYQAKILKSARRK